MDWTFLTYAGALGAAVVLCTSMAFLGLFKNHVQGATPFLLANLASAAYGLGSLWEIMAGTPAQVLNALTLEYFGIATIGPLWFLTALGATGDSWKMGTLTKASLFIVPGIIVLSVATNPLHHLFYTQIQVHAQGPFMVPDLGKGPLYFLNLFYMNLCLVLSAAVALKGISHATKPEQKIPRVLIFVAGLFPWIGMVLYLTGLSPYGLDTAPFGLVFSGILASVALFRYRIYALTPVMTGQVLEFMKEGVLVLDPQNRVLGANPAAQRIFPTLKPEALGSPLEDLAPQTQVHGSEFELEGPEGRQIFQVERSPLRDRKLRIQGEILLLTDVTERSHLIQRMEYLARTDELTQLPNRRAFLEALTKERDRTRRYGGRFTLVMADVDYFKKVNDRWGHEAGDLVLKECAQTWSEGLRTTDTLARYGGEEFIFLFPGTGLPECETLLERLRGNLERRSILYAQDTIQVTASFGVTSFEGPQLPSLDQMISQADQALYQAKDRGRNRIEVFTSPLAREP